MNYGYLKVTRASLIQADIWTKVIWSDISDPDVLEKGFKRKLQYSSKKLTICTHISGS
ncbi:AprA-related methyltransferase [Aquimarina sp. M1]